MACVNNKRQAQEKKKKKIHRTKNPIKASWERRKNTAESTIVDSKGGDYYAGGDYHETIADADRDRGDMRVSELRDGVKSAGMKGKD